jgi:hypothetical protein
MLFKRTALFFLMFASATLLLHNIVPHSHKHSPAGHHSHIHDAHVSGGAHHHDNVPADNPSDEETDLTNILSVIYHHSEGVTFLTHNVSYAIAKKLTSVSFLIPDNFYLNDFILPPLLQHLTPGFFECTFFYPCTNTLRGPPFIAV